MLKRIKDLLLLFICKYVMYYVKNTLVFKQMAFLVKFFKLFLDFSGFFLFKFDTSSFKN